MKKITSFRCRPNSTMRLFENFSENIARKLFDLLTSKKGKILIVKHLMVGLLIIIPLPFPSYFFWEFIFIPILVKVVILMLFFIFLVLWAVLRKI